MPRAPDPPPPATQWRHGAWLLTCLILGFGALRCWPWVCDDAFVSLRYAANLLAGDGLVWNPGEAVEGYSNLGFVLLTAALHGLGVPWLTAARLLGVLGSLGTLWVVSHSPLLPRRGAAGFAVLLLAASPSLALWTIGGLETTPAAWLLTLGALRIGELLTGHGEPRRAARHAGLAFAGLALLRADGAAFAIPFLLAMLLATPPPTATRWVLAVRGVVPPLTAVAAQLLFRRVYYGAWLPNTALVKLDGSAAAWQLGLDHLRTVAHQLRSLWLPALVGCLTGLRDPRQRWFVAAAVVTVLGHAGYVASLGGELFPLARLFVPGLGLLATLAGLGIAALATRHGTRLAGGVAVGCLMLAVYDARPAAVGSFTERSLQEWRGVAVGGWLRNVFADASPPPLLAVDAAGAVPFYSGLPCLDMLGLCDRSIAMAPPPDPRHPVPGHARGNAAYVLQRAPDLVLFGPPTGALVAPWAGGQQLQATAEFRAAYAPLVWRTGPVTIVDGHGEDLRLVVHARRDGGCGLQQSAQEIVVPAFWFAAATDQGAEPAHGRWLGDGLVLEVPAVAKLPPLQLPLPAGEWLPRLEPATAPFRLVLADRDGTPLPEHGRGYHQPQAGIVALQLICTAPALGPTGLRHVALHRR